MLENCGFGKSFRWGSDRSDKMGKLGVKEVRMTAEVH